MKRYAKQHYSRLWIVAFLALIGLVTASDKAFSAQIETPAKRLGDRYGGGIIFYVDATGQHGLIAAPGDFKEKMTWDKAITECKALEYDGYSDWRLPSLNELNKLFLAKSSVGGFADSDEYYWSSSVEKSGKKGVIIWYQDFGDGTQIYIDSGKTEDNRVRAVRAF